MEAALKVEGLYKSYPAAGRSSPREALSGLSLEVPRGSVVGLLGPNGAGKTTTLKIVMGLVHPDRGRVEILGSDSCGPEVRGKIGFLPEQPYFDMYLTPRKLLRYYARLLGLKASEAEARGRHLLSLMGLEKEGDLSLEKFSKGMLQRLGIAQALLGNPELLLLDEPSTGLDPLGKIQVRDILQELREQGVAVLVSSHQLSEIEEICDRVVLVERGRTLASGTLDELLGGERERLVILEEPCPDDFDPVPVGGRWLDGGRTRLVVPEDRGNEVLRSLLDRGIPVAEFKARRMTLEEFFVEALRGRKER
jgi:ABC-2 type transport system ATP-binding protein